jgi:hypothetical protein
VRNTQFYGQKNGEAGLRRWTTLAGFSWVREYPDIANAGNRVVGLMGDSRLVAVSIRKLHETNNVAEQLGTPKSMEFFPLTDPQSGLELTGVVWQEAGTGDVFLSVAMLFGASVGNGNGLPGTRTDYAGCLIQSV